MKINFQKIKIFTSISHKEYQMIDAREKFADMIYKNVPGIKANAIALKIYKSEGDTDYNSDEIQLIKNIVEQLGLPGFIDGFNEQLENTGG